MTNALERFGSRLADKQIKNKSMFFIVLLIIVGVTLPGIPLLLGHVEPSLEKILPQEVEEVKLMNNMRSEFGADMMYILITPIGPTMDVRDPDVLRYTKILADNLRANELILEVNTLSDVILEMNDGIIPSSNQEIRQLMALHPQTPRYVNTDYSLSVMHIRSDTGATASLIKRVVDDTRLTIKNAEEYNPGVSLQLTGFNTIDKATFEVIIKDFSQITGLSFALMLIFLFFYFNRSVKKILATVSVIMFSLLITLGLTGYIGITVTVVTMVAAAMIMALGISYGINVTFDYFSLRKKFEKKDALRKLNTNLIRALVGSSLTTSAGFLALLFGLITAMKNLGVVLAMGIVITLAVSIFFLPVILYSLDKENKEKIDDKNLRNKKKKKLIILGETYEKNNK